MPRNLYSPRLSDDVVRALYREGQRRRKPMTVVADTLLRQALASAPSDPPQLRVCEDPTPYSATPKPDTPKASAAHHQIEKSPASSRAFSFRSI